MGKMRLFNLAMAALLVGTIFIPAIKQAKAASFCQCTQYVANRFGIATFPNATDWNDGTLQNNGFFQVSTPLVGSVVVIEGYAAGTSAAGHVAVVASYNSSTGSITTRGANQSPMGSETEASCYNVNTVPWGVNVNGNPGFSFWVRPPIVPTDTSTLFSGDYDGDLKSDFGIFRRSDATTYFLRSSSGFTTTGNLPYGFTTDAQVRGDFDGDKKTDVGIYRSGSVQEFHIRMSTTGLTLTKPFGMTGDVPLSMNDYDGDGKSDIAIFRKSESKTIYVSSKSGVVSEIIFGLPSDIQVRGDFDGDKKTDVAVYRPGATQTFYIRRSSNGATLTKPYGEAGDIPLSMNDYDGDGMSEIALYRQRNNTTYYLTSASGFMIGVNVAFGFTTDTQVRGDFDGDGRTDIGIYRTTSNGVQQFHVRLSSNGNILSKSFGAYGDMPI